MSRSPFGEALKHWRNPDDGIDEDGREHGEAEVPLPREKLGGIRLG